METKMTEQESLKIISEMIENSKANLRDNSFFYLLWGWLILAAALMNFILLQVHYEKSWLPWPVLTGGGLIVTFLAGLRLGRKSGVRTYFDTAMIFLWNAFLVVLIIVLYMAGTARISWLASDAIIIALYGLGTFVSGGIFRFKPLIWGGVFCWVMAMVVLYVPGIYSFLIIAASIVVAYLIPGYMLKNRFKNRNHV